MKENTFYFTHDFNAQNDEKVESMIFRLGWESYGLFWALIEKLAQDPNHRLKKEYDRISNVLRTTENLIKRIVEDFGLFVVDLEFFYSERLIRHFEKREEKSQKAKDSIKKRWDKNTNVIRTYNECNTIKERKGKENKVNEIKEKEILKEESMGAEAPGALKKVKKIFIPPTIEEIKAYIQEKDLKGNADSFFNHYEANGWRYGKAAIKMADWKAALRNWRSDLEYKKPNQATNGKMTHDEALRIAGERIKEEERLASLKPASLENHSITEELINDF